MGCGCGNKSVARPPTSSRVVAPTGGDSLAKAQTYQSATMRGAPTAPVTRKTV